MAFNQNIPQPSDALDQSQADLLANFQALKALIDINHGTFSAADEGKHKWVTMPEQSAAPTTALNDIAMYTKAVSGVTQLFLRNENNGSEVDFTSANKSTSDGTLTLPSGIILKWGRATSNGSGIATVTFGTAFPTAILTAYGTTSVVGGSSATGSGPTGKNDILTRVYNYTTTKLEIVTFIVDTPRTRNTSELTWFAVGH